jgi:hypothetical protein
VLVLAACWWAVAAPPRLTVPVDDAEDAETFDVLTVGASECAADTGVDTGLGVLSVPARDGTGGLGFGNVGMAEAGAAIDGPVDSPFPKDVFLIGVNPVGDTGRANDDVTVFARPFLNEFKTLLMATLSFETAGLPSTVEAIGVAVDVAARTFTGRDMVGLLTWKCVSIATNSAELHTLSNLTCIPCS